MITVLYLLCFTCIVGSLLPLIDSEHWIIRGQSYFRAIYLGLNLVLLSLVVTFTNYTIVTLVAGCFLIISIVLCFQSVLPFTKLGRIQVEKAEVSIKDKQLSILIFNVYQFNHKYNNLLDLIKKTNPDVVFLIETNTAWAEGVRELKKDYPYHFDDIRENTYGLMLFSKVELLEGGINYLVKPNIPSAEILLPINGCKIRILGIHPKPPVPGESYSSKSKDKELVQAAIYFKKQVEDDHQILIGDLNDVAWSRASLGFKKMTAFQDPRSGRGFYSTFPTWSPIRIPLDHVFCSKDLKLVDFRILEDIGSDHFPVLVNFHISDKN